LFKRGAARFGKELSVVRAVKNDLVEIYGKFDDKIGVLNGFLQCLQATLCKKALFYVFVANGSYCLLLKLMMQLIKFFLLQRVLMRCKVWIFSGLQLASDCFVSGFLGAVPVIGSVITI
jgi:hypothetical protein